MMERCPACNAKVLSAPGGTGFLRCDKCGMRFPRPRKKRDPAAWNARDDEGLGIHPALARRYKDHAPTSGEGEGAVEGGASGAGQEPPPSVQLSPSLVGEGARVLGADPAVELPPLSVDEDPADTDVEAASSPPAREGGPRGGTRPLDDEGRRNDTPVQRPRRDRERPRPKEEPLPELPGYEILEQVGKGAMGRVFKARDLETGSIAGVKVLAPELAARPDFVARFEREAAALGRVRHRGVVSILASGSSGELHYLSMQFVEGVALRRILDAGPLPPGRALAFARQIVQGLGAAHDVGVIHRDLKPENILVEQRPREGKAPSTERLVLVDFGLAGIIDENEDPHPNLTKSRMTMGTVNYMAPEQRTDAKRVDQRADLYATGVILYELLTGDLPLGRFALPTERGLQLPASIDDLIVKALARAPDERYQSAQELDKDLAAIEEELSRAASMDTLVGRGSLPSERPPEGRETSEGDDESSGASGAPASAASPATRGPEWHTAPPWVKRPELLWGILALAVGAVAGLWVAPGSGGGEERVVSAPALELATEDGRGVATLGRGLVAEDWRASGDGWSADPEGASFEPDASRAGLSLLRASSPLTGERIEARAVLAPLGDGPGYGAVLLVRPGGAEGIGVLRQGDGSCGVLRVERGRASVETLACEGAGGATRLGVLCTPAAGSCALRVGAQVFEGIAAPAGGEWTFGLGCDGARCVFRVE